MYLRVLAWLSPLLFLCCVSGNVLTAEEQTPEKTKAGQEFFETHIRPLFVKHCYECHSEAEEQRMGGLLLDRESGWINGGETGQSIVPGDVKGSLLIEAVTYKNEKLAMPPENKLADEEIDLLVKWVRMGAPGPIVDPGETAFSQFGNQNTIFEKAARHWAFQPVQPVDPPEAEDPAWNQHPIDQFISAKLKENQLKPSPVAKSDQLRRRLALDLTGLPVPEQAPEELPQYIEDLLASPHFGEHLARLWLDVARYADTANVSVPATRPAIPQYYPYAFTYRDYVINAFNNDKPYDQFIREQLAADLLGMSEDDPDQAALGLIAVTPMLTNPHDFADDMIDTVSRGLLGLTVACARCHDHKFEPIPTADYYSLYGVFRSIEKPAPEDFEAYPLIQAEAPSAAQQEEFETEKAKIDKKIQAALKSKRIIGAQRKESDILQQGEMTRLVTFNPGAPTRAIVVKETNKPLSPQIFLRGEPDTRGERVPRRFLKLLDPEQQPFPEDNSGRLALAEKIASPENPLTARVFVNRVWGLLLGSYLVNTPSDFGLQGSQPTHPELLDWLADDFVKNGWSVKHLVRTIVTSRTYQQSSTVRSDASEVDPENLLYHRANLKRMSFEQLRDSILAMSGQLDPRVLGRSEQLWGDNPSRRRAIYGLVNRIEIDPTMRAFDFPTPTASADRRTENIVPQQALFALNSSFVNHQSRYLVESLSPEMPEQFEDQVAVLYQHIYQRQPSPFEQTRIGRFAELMQKRNTDPLPLIAQSLLISNEFIYVD